MVRSRPEFAPRQNAPSVAQGQPTRSARVSVALSASGPLLATATTVPTSSSGDNVSNVLSATAQYSPVSISASPNLAQRLQALRAAALADVTPGQLEQQVLALTPQLSPPTTASSSISSVSANNARDSLPSAALRYQEPEAVPS